MLVIILLYNVQYNAIVSIMGKDKKTKENKKGKITKESLALARAAKEKKLGRGAKEEELVAINDDPTERQGLPLSDILIRELPAEQASRLCLRVYWHGVSMWFKGIKRAFGECWYQYMRVSNVDDTANEEETTV